MPDVNPVLHMDKDFLWRWYEVDDHGDTSFQSPKTFFSKEDCQRDYDEAMQRLKRS